MQKSFTSSKKTDLSTDKKKPENSQKLEPKVETLQLILEFASSYRVHKISENQYIEWYLN